MKDCVWFVIVVVLNVWLVLMSLKIATIAYGVKRLVVIIVMEIDHEFFYCYELPWNADSFVLFFFMKYLLRFCESEYVAVQNANLCCLILC